MYGQTSFQGVKGGNSSHCILGCEYRGEVPAPDASNEEIIQKLCNTGQAAWDENEAVAKFAYANENPDRLTIAEMDSYLAGQDHLPVGKVWKVRYDLLHFLINWPGKSMLRPLALKQLHLPHPLPRG